MPRVFITERDIEEMVKRGILSLEINDNVVLTDLAYEKAKQLGVSLARDKPDGPPSAPVRPYITKLSIQSQNPTPVKEPSPPISDQSSLPAPQPEGVDLHQRIHNTVIARLGNQVDAKLLDVIITRVLQSTGVK